MTTVGHIFLLDASSFAYARYPGMKKSPHYPPALLCVKHIVVFKAKLSSFDRWWYRNQNTLQESYLYSNEEPRPMMRRWRMLTKLEKMLLVVPIELGSRAL